MRKPTTKQLVSNPETLRAALEALPFWSLTESADDGMHTVGYMGAGEFVRRDAVLAALAASEQHSDLAADLAAQLLQVQVTLEKARKFVRGRHSTISYGPMQLVVEIDVALRLLEALGGDQP